jgi:type IX secretion system PorP/SprF family membrane protein
MKSTLLLSLFAATFSFALHGQDPMFSQFYAAPMQINPALTGLVDAPTIHINYRNQWSAINRAYATYAVAFSQYAPKLNSGFGVQALADVAGNGIYNTTQINLSYAYDIRFDENFYIRAGLDLGFASKRLNWNKLIFLDQIDPQTGAFDPNGNLNPTEEAMISNSINYFDVSMGMVMHTRYWYAGFSFKHLNSPNEAFYNINNADSELPIRATFHAGAEIPLGKHNKQKYKTFISPNLLFVKQRNFYQLNLGAYAQHQNIFGGLFFRHTFGNSDAVILTAGIAKGVFKLGYSYDLTVSQLTPNSGGTHELSLILNFQDENKKHARRYNDCLQIFR